MIFNFYACNDKINITDYYIIICAILALHILTELLVQNSECYRRSGNFRVKKLSYDKFSCKKIFVGTTPLVTALALIVHANFRKINFRSRHRP